MRWGYVLDEHAKVRKQLLLRRPHWLRAAECEPLVCEPPGGLPHPKRRQHRWLRLVGHGAALLLHAPAPLDTRGVWSDLL